MRIQIEQINCDIDIYIHHVMDLVKMVRQGDVFDGKCYLDLLKMGYFQDEHDIALTGSIDGCLQ